MESSSSANALRTCALLLFVLGCGAHVQIGGGGDPHRASGSYSSSGSFSQASSASYTASKSGSYSYSGAGSVPGSYANGGVLAGTGAGAASGALAEADAAAGASSLSGVHSMGPGTVGITIGHNPAVHPNAQPHTIGLTITGAGAHPVAHAAAANSGSTTTHDLGTHTIGITTHGVNHQQQGQSLVQTVQPVTTNTFIHDQERTGPGVSSLPVSDAVATSQSKFDSYGNPINAMHIHIYPNHNKDVATNGANNVGLTLGTGGAVGHSSTNSLSNTATYGLTSPEKPVSYDQHVVRTTTLQTSGNAGSSAGAASHATAFGGQNAVHFGGVEHKNVQGVHIASPPATSYGVPETHFVTGTTSGTSGITNTIPTGANHHGISITLHHNKPGYYGGTFGGAPGIITATGPATNYHTNSVRVNTVGVHPVGVNTVGVHPVGVNTVGVHPVGVNSVGVNSVGFNVGVVKPSTSVHQHTEQKTVSYGGSFGGAPGIITASGPAPNYPNGVKPLKIEHEVNYGTSVNNAGASGGGFSVGIAKPSFAISTSHKQGHYGGTYGGAPGIITATGPAINYPHVSTVSTSNSGVNSGIGSSGIDIRTETKPAGGVVVGLHHPVVMSHGSGVKGGVVTASGSNVGTSAGTGSFNYGHGNQGGLYGMGIHHGTLLGGMLHGMAGALSGGVAGALAGAHAGVSAGSGSYSHAGSSSGSFSHGGASAGALSHSTTHGFGVSGHTTFGGGNYGAMRQYGTVYKSVPVGRITITTKTRSAYAKPMVTASNYYKTSSYGVHTGYPGQLQKEFKVGFF